jgi:hypothetical protein
MMMKKITRRSVLEEMREMAWHNVMCYSDNLLFTKPKDGKREEWEAAQAKARIVEEMLAELPQDESE